MKREEVDERRKASKKLATDQEDRTVIRILLVPE
jgi:hypothetical protein